MVLLYNFYQTVCYATHDHHFPSESEECAAIWVGFAEYCGDSLTKWFQMLIPLKSSTEVLLGPELSRIITKGLLKLEGKIISLTPKP